MRIGGLAIVFLAFAFSTQAMPDGDAPSGSLADDVDFYRSACIAPFFEGKDEAETLGLIAASDSAEEMLARLARGAPEKWRGLSDRAVPVAERLASAIGLLGMAISHGNDHEQKVAEAYTAQFFPVPQTEVCQRPAGLHDYLDTHNFWASPASSR